MGITQIFILYVSPHRTLLVTLERCLLRTYSYPVALEVTPSEKLTHDVCTLHMYIATTKVIKCMLCLRTLRKSGKVLYKQLP